MRYLKFSTAVILALCCFALSSCGQKNSVPQSFNHNPDLLAHGVSEEDIATMDALLESYIDDAQVPCLTAFVAKGGDVLYHKSFGYKNLEEQIPAEKDDIYVIFSQTKAIVAVALMKLYEQGLLDVEDPISKWLPEFPDKVAELDMDGSYTLFDAVKPVTIAHLLSHSSGFMAPATSGYVRSISEEGKMPRAPRTTIAENVKFNMQFPLGFEPGTQWNYNLDMDVIAYLVEIISGKPLPEFLEEEIFTPLGMEYTAYYYDDEALRPRFVTSYNKTAEGFGPGGMGSVDAVFNGPKTYAGGTFGLYGTIEDYAKFCQMILNGGEFNGARILKPETIELMSQNRLPELENKPGFQFGLGFELYRGTPSTKVTERMSDSCLRWGGAAGTEYMIDPENDMVILYYVNLWNRPDTFTKFLDKAYELFN